MSPRIQPVERASGDDLHALIPWRLLADRTPVPTVLIDAEGTCLHASQSFATLLGTTVASLTELPLVDLIHPEDQATFLGWLSAESPTGLAVRSVRICFADLTWHEIRWNLQPLGNAAAAWLLLTADDVSANQAGPGDLLRRTELQLLLDRINGTFASSSLSGTDDVIVDALQAIATHLGADRAYVLTYDFDNRTESMTHEWAGPGVIPELNTYVDISFDIVPSGIIRSLRGEIVAVQSWDTAGSEWDLDREFLEAEGILSTIELPIARHGHVTGSVGFDWTTRPGTWTDQDLDVLRLFGAAVSQLLAHGEHRSQLQRQLEASQARFASLVDNIPDPVMRVGILGEVLFANAAARSKLLVDERGRLRESEEIWSQLAAAQDRAFELLEEQTVTFDLSGSPPVRYLTRVVPELDEFGQARSLLLLSHQVDQPPSSD